MPTTARPRRLTRVTAPDSLGQVDVYFAGALRLGGLDPVELGLLLDQVKAANPTQGYRTRYGSDTGAWTSSRTGPPSVSRRSCPSTSASVWSAPAAMRGS